MISTSAPDRIRQMRIVSAICMGMAVICAIIAIGVGGPVPWHLLVGIAGGIAAMAASFLRGTGAARWLAIPMFVFGAGSLVLSAWTLLQR